MTDEFPTNFTADWFSGNGSNWIDLLGHIKGTPARGLEIGSYEGRSAHWLLENLLTHPNSVLYCVDPWNGEDPCLGEKTVRAEKAFDDNLRRFQGRYKKLKMSSFGALTGLRGMGNKFDFVFIDGNHEGYEALTDLMIAWPLVKPGGWLVFDDYGWEDVNLRSQPRDAFDAWESVKPLDLNRVVAVGRLMFTRKAL